jgi:hypothetical protein
MAETLGSLIDKLTIKDLREYHMREMLERQDPKFTKEELTEKLELLAGQKKQMQAEIDEFVVRAMRGEIPVRDDKLKIYNKRDHMGKTGDVTGIAAAIEGLIQANTALWHLEDEARREDVELAYIGEVKRKIDVTNQRRNDFIDLIDQLFEKKVNETSSVK